MKKGKVFQEDLFELDFAALLNDIFIWQAADLTHINLLIFKYRATTLYLYIFDSMLKIFITQTRSNRELSIYDRMRKILGLMTKICMVFFSVFVCLDGIEAEN